MDLSQIVGEFAVPATPWAAILTVFIYTIRGGLIPRKTYDDMVVEKNSWKTAYFKQLEANNVLVGAVGKFNAYGDVTAHFLKELPQADGTAPTTPPEAGGDSSNVLA